MPDEPAPELPISETIGKAAQLAAAGISTWLYLRSLRQGAAAKGRGAQERRHRSRGRAAVLADLERARGRAQDVERAAVWLRDLPAELAAHVADDPAWPALALQLHDVAEAGQDPSSVLAHVAGRRGFGDAESVAQVLHWRVGAFLDGTHWLRDGYTPPAQPEQQQDTPDPPAGQPATPHQPAASPQADVTVDVDLQQAAGWLADLPAGLAERITAEAAWPELAGDLYQLAAAGQDPAAVAALVAGWGWQNLSDVESVTAVLRERLERFLGGEGMFHYTPPAGGHNPHQGAKQATSSTSPAPDARHNRNPGDRERGQRRPAPRPRRPRRQTAATAKADQVLRPAKRPAAPAAGQQTRRTPTIDGQSRVTPPAPRRGGTPPSTSTPPRSRGRARG